MPNHDSEHYPPKEKMLRAMIWHLFSENMSQGEKNLILSNLYLKLSLQTSFLSIKVTSFSVRHVFSLALFASLTAKNTASLPGIPCLKQPGLQEQKFAKLVIRKFRDHSQIENFLRPQLHQLPQLGQILNAIMCIQNL